MADRVDLLLLNGVVHSPLGPAGAVACSGDRIVAVGTAGDLRRLRNRRTETVDLGGRSVLPAFADAHCHFALFASQCAAVDLKGVPSVDEAVRRVAAAVATKPSGAWVTGHGWLHDQWAGVQPTRQLLDSVAPGYPIVLWRNDYHALWASSEALAQAGITATTPAPPGGAIVCDASGQPTGVLVERAMDLLAPALPVARVGELAQAIAAAQPVAHRAGLAAITCPEMLDSYRAFRLLRERGQLTIRVDMCLAVPDFAEEVDLLRGEGRGDHWLRWTHLKVFADGAIGPRTAYLLAPYEDDPANRGICVTPPDELRHLIQMAATESIACAVHAIGDAANRVVLDAFSDTQQMWRPKALRPRIEHAQVVAPEDLPRFAELGVIASMQPIHATQDFPMTERALGRRSRYAYPFRSLLASGAGLAFGSDAPVESLDVIAGIHAAVARRRADGSPPGGWYRQEGIGIRDAVRAYTVGAAWATYQETSRGGVQPGKLADLVILSEDIFAMPPERLLEAKVEGTIVGGRWAYRAF